MSNLKLTVVEKNSLFHGQYRYTIKFKLNELGVIRGLNPDSIDRAVNDRNRWRQQTAGYYGSFTHRQITPENVQQLKEMCELLQQCKPEIKFTVSYNIGYVYTNNIDILDKIAAIDYLYFVEAKEVTLVGVPNTISRKDPKWTHRTYIRGKVITEQQRESLIEYLQARENIRLSPGLSSWIKNSPGWNNWLHDYYFFDHNDDGEVLFLNMVVPRITGRTLQIVAK